jgi:DNA-binding Xre family transcriptional regulator
MRIYRIDYFVAAKADRDNKTRGEILKEAMALIGLSEQSFRNLRNTQATKSGRLSPHLYKLSIYFDCKMDDLINPDAKAEILNPQAAE